jgi:broad specificity phosphatase PhoE
MVDALQLMGARHRGETVAAVTHAVMIRLTLVALGGVDGENWRIPVGRGSVTVFDAGPDGLGLAAPPDGGAADLPPSGTSGSGA